MRNKDSKPAIQKKVLSNLLIISLCGILLSSVVFFIIQTFIAESATDAISISKLRDVEERISANKLKLENLVDIVREDNLARARALAILLEAEPILINDTDKLNGIAAALNVDEIHIIDENGILKWGTQPHKYGMDFSSNEQTRPFLAILDDPTLEIAQVPMPNASLGVIRQYAGVSLRHMKGIAEVGVVPSHFIEAAEEAGIGNVLRDIELGKTGYIFSVSNETKLISAHPNPALIGTELSVVLRDYGYMKLDGKNIRYHTYDTVDEMIITAYPVSEMFEQRLFSTSFFLLFIIILFIVFFFIINFYLKRSIVTGIRSIMQTLDVITTGNLNITADVRSNAEFDKLSDGINHMLASIKSKIVEVEFASAKLSAIFTSIPDAVFSMDINGVYTSCNRSFEIQAGMPESKIIGKTYQQVFVKADTQTVTYNNHINKTIIDERKTVASEETVVYPDGNLQYLDMLKAPLIQNGKVVGLLGVGRNVTEYKEIKNRLERIINTAQVAFLSSIDGIITEANEYSKKHLGVQVGEQVIAIYHEPIQREKLVNIDNNNDTINEIVKFKMANGEINRFFVNVSFVEHENKKAFILWGINIEQDEVNNDRIRNMQQSLQTILDFLPIPVRILDLESKSIVYANKAMLELLEYETLDQIFGKRANEILPQYTRDGINVTESESSAYEIEFATKTGKIIESLVVVRQIEYQGRPSSIGIVRDLSAERERERLLMNAMEREKEANHAKSMFLANMSHEIRTPMNGIIGFSELALDDYVTTEAKNDYLRKIRSSGEGLLQIINDILDISKIESGKMELENIPFDIHEVFRICQTIITPKALEKGITLYCYAEPSIGKKLLGDPTRLRQVLLNLLSNAVKFTNVGTIKLMSEITASTDDTVTMFFEVKDSGIGMTLEQIEIIFDPFSQADTTTTRRYGGTGLGLSITQNLIKQMGGTLKVDSAPGIGSKFTFSITFKTINIASEIDNHDIIINEYEKPTFDSEILFCEDNVINQQVIRDHLTRVGIKTVLAVNGQVGVNIVRDRMSKNMKPFDLIFMDIHMPVMDGLEAAKILKEIGCKTPIVAVTANVMTTSREIYREHGMPDYLAKPFRTQELWACLLKYLTPVGFKSINIIDESEAEIKQLKKIQANFVTDYQTAYQNITYALSVGDIASAHRYAHSLKSVAGFIKRAALVEAAQAVELSLAGENADVSQTQMDRLEYELNLAVNELTPLVTKGSPSPSQTHFDEDDPIALLNALSELLAANNTECLDWVDKLKNLPGSEALIEQIEYFDFPQACESLAVLKEKIRSDI